MGALPPNPCRSPPRWLGGNDSALRLARFARALGNPYLTQSLNGASLRQAKLPSKNFNKKLE
jgi:hypothetical protein